MFFVFLLFSLKNSEEDVVLNFVRVSGGGLRGGDSNFENKEISKSSSLSIIWHIDSKHVFGRSCARTTR